MYKTGRTGGIRRTLRAALCLALALAMAFVLSGCFELLEIPDYSESREEQGTAASLELIEDSGEEAAFSETEETGAESAGTDPEEQSQQDGPQSQPEENVLDEHGTYTTKDDVALYIHTYGHLPDNFITKEEARELGWTGGSLEPYAKGCCIGGDYFGNREGLLPKAKGRKYTECDIDTLGADSRAAKRIVFSNDGLIYYTEDHYETFVLLYGEE